MGPKSRSGGVGIGYVRPVQFLDHLTVIKISARSLADFGLWIVILDFRFWLLHFDVGGQSGCSRVFVQRDV